MTITELYKKLQKEIKNGHGECDVVSDYGQYYPHRLEYSSFKGNRLYLTFRMREFFSLDDKQQLQICLTMPEDKSLRMRQNILESSSKALTYGDYTNVVIYFLCKMTAVKLDAEHYNRLPVRVTEEIDFFIDFLSKEDTKDGLYVYIKELMTCSQEVSVWGHRRNMNHSAGACGEYMWDGKVKQ